MGIQKRQLCGFVLVCVLASCTDAGMDEESSVATVNQRIWRGQEDSDDPLSNSVAYLTYGNVNHPSQECSSTLITYGLALTAAHCVSNPPPANAGLNPAQMKGDANRKIIEVRTRNDENAARDIALALLDAPTNQAELDQAYPQKPTFRQPWFGDAGTVVSYYGYGHVRPGDGFGPDLNIPLTRQQQVGVVMPKACFKLSTIESKFNDRYFGIDGGDSGGPIYAELHNPADLQDNLDPWVRRDQIGVASKGISEDGPDGISIWTNLLDPMNIAWILDNANDPNRPDRWIGERDYVGACRTDVDANCDRYFDDNARGYPVVFDGGGQTWYERDFMHEGIAVYATHTLELNDRVQVLAGATTALADVMNAKRGRVEKTGPSQAAFVPALGDTIIGEDVKVGDILSRASVWVRGRATIESIHTHGSITAPLATVGRADPTDARMPPIRLTADFSDPSLGNVTAEPGANPQLTMPDGQVQAITGCLPPGRYSKLSLKSRTLLNLCAGEFKFDDFWLEPDATVTPDNSATTAIFVRSSVVYRGVMNADPSRLLFGYFGTYAAFLERTFRGTFVAPNALVDLSSTVHWGAYAGRAIRAHQGGTIRFVALNRQ